MSALEPPTVLTRPPPSRTPDLPPSPAPSSHHFPSSTPPERSAYSPPPQQASGTTTPTRGGCADGVGGLKEKKRQAGRGGMSEARWRSVLKEWKLLLTLENSGSVARDHLASERTFLAYARTSLTIASTGVGASLSPSALFRFRGACSPAFVLSLSRPRLPSAPAARPRRRQRSSSSSRCPPRRRTRTSRGSPARSGPS